MPSPTRVWAAALSAAVTVTVALPAFGPGAPVAPVASAIPRPQPGGPQPPGDLTPGGPVTLDGRCRTTASTALATGSAPRWSSVAALEPAWVHGRGAGQRVAVVDTGVNPGARLTAVRGIGDLVAGKSGLEDCDAHGTLVAGVIAGRPDPATGVTGIAPDAEILSLRQSSAVLTAARTDEADPVVGAARVGSVSTLARAVRAAADAGATVLNISEVACVPAGTRIADGPLGAALRYAVDEKDVVVVVAAGNLGGGCRAQNPEARDPLGATDPWAEVVTTASPAYFDSLVVTVGAVDGEGRPADFSLRGPWVALAAPGVGVVSVGADGSGTATALVPDGGAPAPLDGTSFAAPYVAGVAALVRGAHPTLSAREVMARLRRSTVPVAGGGAFATGAGVLDPVAAVSGVTAGGPGTAADSPLEVPPPPATEHGRTVGAVVAAVVLAAVLAAMIGLRLRRLVPEDGEGTEDSEGSHHR